MESTTQTSNEVQLVEAQGALPKQTIDMSKQNIQPAPLFQIMEKSGMIYRSDFSTWSFYVNGRGCTFEFYLNETQPIDLTASLCAAIVGGKANCPISATINGKILFTSYNDQNCNWHTQTWKLSSNLTQIGWNILVFTLDPQASTQIFMNSITVDQAILHLQTIDLSQQLIVSDKQLLFIGKQNVYYRQDFTCWSFYDKGIMNFELDICDPTAAVLTLNLCSAIVENKTNCPITVSINGVAVLSHFDDHNVNFHDVAIKISSSNLKPGKNQISISLDPSATTQMFIKRISATGE